MACNPRRSQRSVPQKSRSARLLPCSSRPTGARRGGDHCGSAVATSCGCRSVDLVGGRGRKRVGEPRGCRSRAASFGRNSCFLIQAGAPAQTSLWHFVLRLSPIFICPVCSHFACCNCETSPRRASCGAGLGALMSFLRRNGVRADHWVEHGGEAWAGSPAHPSLASHKASRLSVWTRNGISSTLGCNETR